jgi:hypothetical protein
MRSFFGAGLNTRLLPCSFLWLLACVSAAGGAEQAGKPLELLPYPQQLDRLPGELKAGPPVRAGENRLSKTGRIALESLRRYLPREGAAIRLRLGSVEEGYKQAWLVPDENLFLLSPRTSHEASVLRIAPEGITVVGKGRFGMLYGVQTVNQLARLASRTGRGVLPCLAIRDWPDVKWRCLAPALTWYSGFNRLEGYDLNNWSRDEWKWLVDWSLLHKCNAWAVCMCGYWPFALEGYPESVLDVPSDFFNPLTGKKERRRFVHPNIKREFYPMEGPAGATAARKAPGALRDRLLLSGQRPRLAFVAMGPLGPAATGRASQGRARARRVRFRRSCGRRSAVRAA